MTASDRTHPSWPVDSPVRYRNIDELQPRETNPRTHTEAQIDRLAESIRQWGWTFPVLVDEDGGILAGHGRVAAAEMLGLDSVPCIVAEGWTAAQKQAYVIADNQLALDAGWDEKQLRSEIESLIGQDFNADLLGFGDDLDKLLKTEKPKTGGEDDVEDVAEGDVVTRPGDLWVLGDHWLLCGDATDIDDVKRVMDGDKAALVATDPPYLVDYTGDDRPKDRGKDWTDRYREIDIDDADAFFRAVFTNVLEVLGPKAAIYCWHAHKRSGDIQRIWRELGILDHQQVIWVKPTPVFGRVYWHFRHEPCVMGWRKGDKPEHDGVHDHDSVWEVDWDGKSRIIGNEHPTEKPVELFARPIRKHTAPGDIVFEPFSGSGSQIIAAELTSRQCRAIEISPRFVDVAVRRWEKYTGQKAHRHGG